VHVSGVGLGLADNFYHLQREKDVDFNEWMFDDINEF
jgi:hypothetical protein